MSVMCCDSFLWLLPHAALSFSERWMLSLDKDWTDRTCLLIWIGLLFTCLSVVWVLLLFVCCLSLSPTLTTFCSFVAGGCEYNLQNEPSQCAWHRSDQPDAGEPPRSWRDGLSTGNSDPADRKGLCWWQDPWLALQTRCVSRQQKDHKQLCWTL